MATNDKPAQIVDALNQNFKIGDGVFGIQLLTWVLLLKYVDYYETTQMEENRIGTEYEPALKEPFRWSDWACPKLDNGKSEESRRKSGDELVQFVNNELLPHIREISFNRGAEVEMKPSSIRYLLKHALGFMRELTCDGGIFRNLVDMADQVDFNDRNGMRELAESYEKYMQIKINESRNAGKFYSIRPMIRAIVNAVNPNPNESIYDPAVGTCGFFLEAIKFMKSTAANATDKSTPIDLGESQGADCSAFAFSLGTLNMILHGMEFPNYVIKNVLESDVRKIQDDQRYDVVFSEIPYAEKVASTDVVKNFPIEHDYIEVLYLQHIMASLKDGGRAAVVVPEGMLRRADKEYKLVRKELLENFNVHTVLSLPSGVFLPYTIMKPSVLFFDRKGRTSNIWFYEFHRERDYFRNNSLTDADLEEFVSLFPKRETSKHSWMVPIDDVKVDFNLAAKNPLRSSDQTQIAIKFLNESNLTELELKSQLLLKEINDMFVSYLGIRFEKIKNREFVKDVLDVKTGGSLPNGDKFSAEKTQFPYLRNTCLTCKGTFDRARLKYLSEETYEKLKDHAISEMDLYICATNSIGKTGIVPPELNGAILANDAFKLVIRDKNALDLKYLHLFSMTADFMNQISKSKGYAGGSHLHMDKLHKVEIPVSPIEEQLELVSMAWPIKEKIEVASDLLSDEIPNETEEVSDELQFIQDLKQTIRELLANETSKKLVNPFSTGGGGEHFEVQVQSLFVTLMLTGGRIACLPNGTIREIKLQGRKDGYNTDDIVVFAVDKSTNNSRKLIGQIKHSIRFTDNKRSKNILEDVFQAFWQDYKNPEIFKVGSDLFTLITGPLDSSDRKPVQWLLDHAKHTKDSDEFFRDVEKSNFSPAKSLTKLQVIKSYLTKAKGDCEVSDEETYGFLNCFHLEELDFSSKTSPILSLIYSLISQYHVQDPDEKWSRIVKAVQQFNQHAGTITRANLPESIRDAFEMQTIELNSEKYRQKEEKKSVTNWSEHDEAGRLAMLMLLGRWDSKNELDKEAIKKLIEKNYEDWELSAIRILDQPDSILAYEDDKWRIEQKLELLNQLGPMILKRKLERFFDLVEKVFKKPDQVTGIPNSEFGNNKNGSYSHDLKEGITGGLALIGNNPEKLKNVDLNVEYKVQQLLYKLFDDAKRNQWEALNKYLPNLAEAHPEEFLKHVGIALSRDTKLFADVYEHKDSFSIREDTTYGLRKSLEVLAWHKKHFKKAFQYLCNLEEICPVEIKSDRPFDTILKILLPWSPQTQADVETRVNAVKRLMKNNKDLYWKLLMRLLPKKEVISFVTVYPRWLKKSSDQWKNEVEEEEYWRQSDSYVEMVIEEFDTDVSRMIEVIDNLEYIPAHHIDMIVNKLAIFDRELMSADERKEIWEKLTEFTMKNRKYANATWPLPIEKIEKLEAVTERFLPESQFDRYQQLFGHNAVEQRYGAGKWNERTESLYNLRKSAIREMFESHGLNGILEFADAVTSPGTIGKSLACLDSKEVDAKLIPMFVCSENNNTSVLVDHYISSRQAQKGWEWVDELSDSSWTVGQKTQFLLNLPFDKNTWDRAQEWLSEKEFEYWKKVVVYPNAANKYESAIEKFIRFDRPAAAVYCFWLLIPSSEKISSELAIRSLMSYSESVNTNGEVDDDMILEVIWKLHQNSDVDADKLLKIEEANLFRYFSQSTYRPILIEGKLKTDPEYFSTFIQMAYKSNKSNGISQEHLSEAGKNLAKSAYNLLCNWKSLPGIQDGNVDSSAFKKWFQRVEVICRESGHLDMAMEHIGIALADALKMGDTMIFSEAITEILSEENNGDMRNGFMKGVLNSRRAQIVDTTGVMDKKWAKYYEANANELKSKGHCEFAEKLMEISDSFEKFANSATYQQSYINERFATNRV